MAETDNLDDTPVDEDTPIDDDTPVDEAEQDLSEAETETEADSDDDDEEVRLKPKPTPRAARPWRRYARTGLVAAVFAGAFGTAGYLGWQLWQRHTVTQAAQAAEDTARSYAQVLTSIDSNQVDQNFAAVLNGATGGFKDMYTRASIQLRQLLIDNNAAAKGVVVGSAVEDKTKDKVVVLLMVDQQVTNSARPDPRVDRSRMKLTMENVGGRWLASNVELP